MNERGERGREVVACARESIGHAREHVERREML